VGNKETAHVAGKIQSSTVGLKATAIREARNSEMKGEAMLESDSTEVIHVWKRVLIAFLVLVATVLAKRVFSEFFQCQSPECQRTHAGEP
jgi:hypothetical protein